MIIECKKTENCFADSQTYEYRIAVTAEEFLDNLDDTWQIRCNHKLRRPTFFAEKDALRIKGILKGSVIRVSFPNDNWETYKIDFETWLMNQG